MPAVKHEVFALHFELAGESAVHRTGGAGESKSACGVRHGSAWPR